MALQTRRFFRFHDDLRPRTINARYVSANPQYQKGTTRIRQYVSERFSGTVAISPPIVSAYYLQAPNRGRELSFREAVLPLMYRVREDGLQTANHVRNATCPHVCSWHKADAETALMNVRFEENNGHGAELTRCLLLTQSGHRA